MNTSIFLAQAFGIYLLVLGVALLFNKNYYREAVVSLVEHKGAYFLLGVVTLILGIIVVLFHNYWVANWQVVITLLAWLVLLKGLLRVLIPGHTRKWVKAVNNDGFFYSVVVFSIVLGLYLIYMGFA